MGVLREELKKLNTTGQSDRDVAIEAGRRADMEYVLEQERAQAAQRAAARGEALRGELGVDRPMLVRPQFWTVALAVLVGNVMTAILVALLYAMNRM